MSYQRENKLIDMMYQMAFALRDRPMTGDNEEVAAWVTQRLKNCGFDVEPRGVCWGVLTTGKPTARELLDQIEENSRDLRLMMNSGRLTER